VAHFVISPSDPIVAYVDGGARGNPGPAGFGVRIERPDGTLIEEFGESIGVAGLELVLECTSIRSSA